MDRGEPVNLVVVGIRGFLGSVIGQHALRTGHRVLGVARSSQPDSSWRGEYLQADAMTFDFAPLLREFGADVVLHAVGSASVGRSFLEPHDDFRASTGPWANVLEGVRRSGSGTATLFLSSAAVYGAPQRLPISENESEQPISPYGFHKVICETLGRSYAASYGLRIAHLRLFSILGPSQRKLLVWQLFEKLRDCPSGGLTLEGTGQETRDYLHEDDVASAALGLAEITRKRPEGGVLTVNVASGVESRVLDVAEMIARSFPDTTIVTGTDTRRGDPPRWRANNERLQSLLPDWKPRPLSAAIDACLAAWRKSD